MTPNAAAKIMNRLNLSWAEYGYLAVCLTLLSLSLPTRGDEAVPPAAPVDIVDAVAAPAPKAAVAPVKGERPKVAVIPLRDQINDPMLYFIRRALKDAKADEVDMVVIDMDTPGGRVDHTEEIIAHIRELGDIPVYVFVNQDAISAGAIISIACDRIYMSPHGRIGAAAPIWMTQGGVAEMPPDVREKMLSIIRAMMRGLANENGYREDVAMAMVDDQVEVKIGDEVICDVGELLMMTAQEAVRIYPPMTDPILATGIVDDIDDLLAVLDMANAEIINIEPAGSEQLAKIITALAPLLMFIGMMGIYMELKTPGFGVPGIVGAVSISIYFFGHYVAGLAGIEDMALVIIGIALIALEILVIPGFGVAGILGIFCLFGGLFMAMIPNLPDVTKMPDFMPEISLWPYIEHALMNTSIAILLIAVGGYCFGRYLPNLPFLDHLILRSATRASDGYVAPNVEENSKLIGEIGMTLTPLRPSGIATINNRRVDVVSNGDFIDQDERVMVKRVQGARVVVIPVAANPEPAESS